ncbi:hypothetical protein Cob_v012528 [Colletotrichum orbiculare MAFF 240422]|uniref:Uncharacterized protein n=1 Tax=Colletotrichum orbiculare (strain 104-T / ATCC 96160 / CBS 514.97 / LARS 414 / MAFF 240422) TaxID=1213857 RepID=A0A484FC16_COLOR|nr:hypothetical protein Cob_v012528 [Colletotrichum orbiculare MAFF 240422]
MHPFPPQEIRIKATKENGFELRLSRALKPRELEGIFEAFEKEEQDREIGSQLLLEQPPKHDCACLDC